MKLVDGQQVEIYRNLNRKGVCFSIRDRKTGLVVHYVDLKAMTERDQTLIIKNAIFHVSEAGRKRVLREQRKNVHALIRGNISLYGGDSGLPLIAYNATPLLVGYDPYTTDSFTGCVDKKGTAAFRLDVADWVTLDSRGVIAWVHDTTISRLARK